MKSTPTETSIGTDLWYWFLKKLKVLLDETLEALVQLAIKLDKLSRYIDNIFRAKQPSFHQYANRLIEFIDGQYINEAFDRFEALVRAGVAPDHAFRMIVGQPT